MSNLRSNGRPDLGPDVLYPSSEGYASPTLGQIVKVRLPGETPWAIVRGLTDDRILIGEINNHLMLTKEHGVTLGDVVRFTLVDYTDGRMWERAQT